MSASGYRRPADLAKEAKRRGFPVSRQNIEKWLKMKRARMGTEDFLIVCEITGYRPRWIVFGYLPMLMLNPEVEKRAQLQLAT